jgi:hypothetical protein
MTNVTGTSRGIQTGTFMANPEPLRSDGVSLEHAKIACQINGSSRTVRGSAVPGAWSKLLEPAIDKGVTNE